MKRFDYIRPRSINDAAAFLFHHRDEAKVIVGGTDLIVKMRAGRETPKFVVDLKVLSGLDRITFDPKVGLTIGALATLNQIAEHPDVVAHYPALVTACNTVGSYPIRNRATLVGNICNASPSADCAPILMVHEATCLITTMNGERSLPIEKFFVGPGKSALAHGEILRGVRIPAPPARSASIYIKLGRRSAMDLATVGVAAFGENIKGKMRVRLAMGAVAPTPLRAHVAEGTLCAASPKEITPAMLAKVAKQCREMARPISDLRGSREYRLDMIEVLVRRAVEALVAELA